MCRCANAYTMVTSMGLRRMRQSPCSCTEKIYWTSTGLSPKTWDELVQQSKTVVSGEGGDMAGIVFKGYECEGLSCSILEYLSNGADVGELTGPNLLEAIRFHSDLIYRYAITPKSVLRAPAGPTVTRSS